MSGYTIDDLTGGMVAALARISRVTINRDLQPGAWVDTRPEHINANTCKALDRRGIVKYGEALGVVRVRRAYLGLATECRQIFEDGPKR